MKSFVNHLLRSIRSTPRGVWVLVGGQFINRLGAFVYPFLALYLHARGFAPSSISVVLASLAAGQFCAPFAGGYLADAIGRRNTIVIALIGGATSMLMIYASDRLAALCLAAAAHGFLSFLFGPAANALITDLVTPAQRQITFSIFRLAINAGFALGPALGGVLFGLGPGLIFYGDAATTLVFAFLAVRHLPHGLRTVGGAVADPGVILRSWLEAASDAWHNRPFVRFYFSMLLMTVAFMQVFTVLSLHATARGLDPFAYGIAMGFNGLMVMVCELPMTHLTQRHSPPRVLALGLTVTGLGCAAFGAATSLGGFIAAMAVFTLGEMMTLPVSSTYASRLAPEEFRGRYFGVLGTIWGLGGLVSSLGPVFYSVMGPWWWVIAGSCSVVGGLLLTAGPAPVHGGYPVGQHR